jgi:copper ion binding protein
MKKIVSVEGMTCGHCAMHVENALKGISGVQSAKVDLKAKSAVIELAHDVADADIKAAVDDAGYEVVGIKEA